MARTYTLVGCARSRHDCPIRIDAPVPSTRGFRIGGADCPAQPDGAAVAVLAPSIPADGSRMEPCDAPHEGGVRVRDDGRSVGVWISGEEFATYHYADVPARPYFWPVLAPGGTRVTRAWPIEPDVPGETHDHKHHRSMYFAFGDVNGVDNWSEEPGHGRTVHRSLDDLVSGPVFGRFATTSDWTDASGSRLLSQRARVTVWAARGDVRLMDVDLDLTAEDGPVRFGDTKEGGILTVRVATPLDVPNGGTITNAYGGTNEPETWGYAAHWCDYSGTVSGQRVGIAVMDHPTSFRYPTYWHVRDYGLMGANPFALSEYTRGAKEGSYVLQPGATMSFRYRVVVHRGNVHEADVRGHYLDFAHPPKVVVSQ